MTETSAPSPSHEDPKEAVAEFLDRLSAALNKLEAKGASKLREENKEAVEHANRRSKS